MNKEKGMVISIGTDTKDFEKGIKKIKKESKDLHRELQNINKGLKFDPLNTTLLKNKMGVVKDQIKTTGKELESLKKQSEAAKEAGLDLSNPQEFRKLQTDIERTTGILEHHKQQYEELKTEQKGAFNPDTSGLASVSAVAGSAFSGLKSHLSGLKTAMQDTVNSIGRGMETIGNKMEEQGSRISGLGNKLSIGVTAPSLIFGKQAFEIAADYEDGLGAIETIFKNSAESITDWASTLPSYLGVAKKEALEYSTIMGTLLQDIGGMSDEGAAQTSKKLVETAADMSAMLGGETKDAVNTLTQALKGNYETLDNYGLGITAATVSQRAMADSGKKNAQALPQQEKQSALLALVFEKTARYSGQAAREADGASGMLKRLSTIGKDFKTDIGQSLIRSFIKPLGKVIEYMEEFKNKSEEEIDGIVKTVFGLAAVGPILKVFGSAWGFLGKGIALIGTKLAGVQSFTGLLTAILSPALLLKGAFIGLAGGLVHFFKNTETGREEMEKFKGSFDGIGTIAQKGLKTLTDTVSKVFERFSGIIEKHWPKLSESFGKVFEDFDGSSISNIFDGIIEIVAGFTDNIALPALELLLDLIGSDTFKKGAETMVNGIESIITAIGKMMNGDFSGLEDIFRGLFEGILGEENTDKLIETFGNIYTFITEEFIPGLSKSVDYFMEEILPPIMKFVEEELIPIYQEHIQPLIEKLIEFIEALWKVLKKLGGYIIKFGKKAWEALSPLLGETAKNAWEILKDTIDGVADTIGTVLDIITGLLTGDKEKVDEGIEILKTSLSKGLTAIGNMAKQIVKSLFEKMVKGIKDIIEGIINFFTGIGDRITDSITGAFKGGLDWLKGKIDWVKDTWDNFKASLSRGFKMPSFDIKLPHFVQTGSTKLGLPKFGVKWYDSGGIFSKPSIIGVGEKRTEVVAALEDLKDINKASFYDVMKGMNYGGGGGDTYNINLDGAVVRSESDIRKLTNEIIKEVERRKRWRF